MSDTAAPNVRPTLHEYAAWTLAGLSMLFVLTTHLLPALIAGLLVYELVRTLAPLFARRLSGKRSREIAAAVVMLLVVGALIAISFGLHLFIKSEGGSLSALLAKMAEILDGSRQVLPPWVGDLLPEGAAGLHAAITGWLREHAAELQRIGRETGHMLAHVMIGMVVGGLVSLREDGASRRMGPFARALGERAFRLGEAFRRIVFAQVRISAINTVLTGLYLALVLPLFGIHLPLTKTLIVVTFVAGLLPVVGNLLSNAGIVVVSLAHSPAVAVASLAFLVLIHKLEYFLNARIVGTQIRASAWELLTAMLVMESLFGVAGLVAAPICYAWLKDELISRQLL